MVTIIIQIPHVFYGSHGNPHHHHLLGLEIGSLVVVALALSQRLPLQDGNFPGSGLGGIVA